ncbi:MAG: anti-sigma factor [Anaerolineales bacterium]|nr:zf-HC2 domain-containing protein [Anaerolineales bacterium]TFH34217.1 MAG: anti-sigma factor [Anaerolineales bacterium]
MSNCPDLIHELSDYIDGLAAPALCAEIERHLQDCPDCKVMVDTLRKTITLYQEQEEKSSFPADVRMRLYRVLDLTELD